MEISNPLQADILHIQEQLKSAIHRHQLLLVTLKVDAENADTKKQLGELQRYIMCLGANQKRLLQELRSKLDESSNSSINSNKKSDSDASNDSPATPITKETTSLNSSNPDLTNPTSLDSPATPVLNDPETPSSIPASQSPDLPEDTPACEEIKTTRSELSDSEQTPSKRPRLESPPPADSPAPSEGGIVHEAPATPPPSIKPSSRASSPCQSEEAKKEPVRTSPSTRSTRSSSPNGYMSSRMLCTPPPKQEEDEDKPGGNLAAAIRREGTAEEQKNNYMACIELLHPDEAKEIKSRQDLKKIKSSAMNPFIKLSNRADPTQNRRRETYLQSHSPRKGGDNDSEASASASDSEDIKSEEEAGENDQLFTEHCLDQLRNHEQNHLMYIEQGISVSNTETEERHPFQWDGKEEELVEEDEGGDSEKEEDNPTVGKQTLEDERDHLIKVHQQLSQEKETLELKKEALAQALQEQTAHLHRILDGEQRTMKSIKLVQDFIAFIQDSDESTSQVTSHAS